MRKPVAIAPFLLWPCAVFAGVLEDFEAGSGGIKLSELDQTVRIFIFAVMCLFVGWVLYSSLKDMVDSGSEAYLQISTRIARSILLCIVVILTIT